MNLSPSRNAVCALPAWAWMMGRGRGAGGGALQVDTSCTTLIVLCLSKGSNSVQQFD
jgi:hypothetical protein